MIAILDQAGRVRERVEYTPYGVARNQPIGDFNGNGMTTVGDLNDADGLLTAFFAGKATADWNRSGLPPTTQDIFDFLTDYFEGTPVNATRLAPNDLSDRAVIDNPVGYCGYAFNRESGDYCVRFRHYAPDYGRWLERDPAGYVDGMSLYDNAKGSPTNHTDPLGLYREAGHYYTSFLAARCAGKSIAEAQQLAYYSQYPDEVAHFDAAKLGAGLTMRGFGKDQAADRWCLDVQTALHALTGGPADRMRDCISELLRDASLPRWMRGVLLHALADSYAHVQGTNRTGDVLYSAPFGHGCSNRAVAALAGCNACTDPDLVGNFPTRHRQYFMRACLLLGGSLTNCMACTALLPSTGGMSDSDEIKAFRDKAIEAGLDGAYSPENGEESVNDKYLNISKPMMQQLIDKIKCKCGIR